MIAMSDSASEFSARLSPSRPAPQATTIRTSAAQSSSRGTGSIAHATAILQQRAEFWVEWLRCAALAVFVGIPLLGIFAQPIAGRITWTVAVALLPLFIVLVGFHRWRRICPIA